jgi:hypothetical protein
MYKCGTFFQDATAVVCSSLGVEDPLLGETSGEHVLRVHLAPQVPVILGVIGS